MRGEVAVEVLGPLHLMVNGRDATPRGWVQRSAFGALACRANEPVSVDELADAVWPVRKPRSPRNALQVAVHRMRASSGRPELVAHSGDGYQLTLATEELDAACFVARATSARTSAQQGDLPEAKRLFDAALHLWRGPMLPDLQDVPIVADATQWLTQQHQSVVEDAADVGVALGGDSELIGSLTTWTRLYPLSERLRGRLMMALYAAGRLADALNAYHAAHRLWIRELGVEPGPELRDLHQRMLNGTPAEELRRTLSTWPAGRDRIVGGASPDLADAAAPARTGDGAAPIPRQLPRDVGDFVGRTDELAAVHAALATGGVCVISGPAGVGKTALAVRAGHRLAERFPDGQLYADLRGAGDRAGSAVAAAFLRALGVADTAIPPDAGDRAAMFRSMLASRRVLVVLDDAADESRVRRLLPGAGASAVLVTGRPRLSGLTDVTSVELDLPSDADGRRMLAAIAGAARIDAEREATAELVRLCGRLPLALRVAATRLTARRHLMVGELTSRLRDERRRLDLLRFHDLDVRAGLALGYDAVPEPARRLLGRLAGLDVPDFAAGTAATLLDTARGEAEQRLDELLDARLIDVAGRDAAGRVRYRLHDLVRVYARERAEAGERPVETRTASGHAVGAWRPPAEANVFHDEPVCGRRWQAPRRRRAVPRSTRRAP